MDFNHRLKDSLLHIGKKLLIIRYSRNEKLITVANAVGISHSTLSRVESGKYNGLSIELLMRLTNYYDITIDELFPNTHDNAEI
jgi:transcriptional regulator with XRE-family HTH domain